MYPSYHFPVFPFLKPSFLLEKYWSDWSDCAKGSTHRIHSCISTVQSYMAVCLWYKATWLCATCQQYKPQSIMNMVQSYLAMRLHAYSTKLHGYMLAEQSYITTCLQYKGTWLHAYGAKLPEYIATCLQYSKLLTVDNPQA